MANLPRQVSDGGGMLRACESHNLFLPPVYERHLGSKAQPASLTI